MLSAVSAPRAPVRAASSAGAVPRTLTVLALDQGRGVWGAQRVLLRLAPLLRVHGIELVLAGPPGLALAAAWRDAGLTHLALDLPLDRSIRRDGDTGPVSPRAALRTALSVPRSVRAVRTAARRVGADAVLANAHWVHLDAALAGRFGGPPAVLLLHEEAVPGLGAQLRSVAVTLAGASVAVSDAVAAGLGRTARRRTRTVPNGVDVVALRPGPADPAVRTALGGRPARDGNRDEVLAVALTRLDPVKRIESVVDAVATARAAGAPLHLALVGATSDYPDYAWTVRAYARERLGEHVTLVGERTDVVEVLRAADLVVHCGTVEGMPLGLLEAQACGRPVVAYAAAGVNEAVADGETGLLTAPGDVDAVAAALVRLAGDPDLRARFGTAGRARVEARHTLAAQAAALAAVLREVTS